MWNRCFVLMLAGWLWLGAVAGAEQQPDARQTAVLLHGLGRNDRSMADMEEGLAARGYRVVNLSYPSTELSIEELAAYLDRQLAACCADAEQPVHFVTHSMGGILVRYYLAHHSFAPLGRVVMLSPPNRGVELIDLTRQRPWMRSLVSFAAGPVAGELGTDPAGLPATLPAVSFELGVITGARSINPLTSWLIPGQDDGTVAVERARVEGMRDFLIVPHTHTFIMDSPQVIEQTDRFLKTGRFEHPSR